MSEQPKLKILEEGRERVKPLKEDQVDVGREDICDVVLNERKSSREHCRFEKGDSGWRVVDLESRNGTKVNGEFTNHHDLEHGDRIQIGDTTIVFELPGAAAPKKKKRQKKKKDKKKKKKTSKTPRSLSPEAKPQGDAPSRNVLSRNTGLLSRVGFLLLVVAAGIGVLYVLYTDQQSAATRSRKAYQEGNQLFEDGKYKEAIRKYKQVSSQFTPDLASRASERRKLAREERIQADRLQTFERAEQTLREGLKEMRTNATNTEDVEEKAQELKEEMRNIVKVDLRTDKRWSLLMNQLQEVKTRYIEALHHESVMKSASKEWESLRLEIKNWSQKKNYGHVADKLFQFRFLYNDKDFDRKSKKILNSVYTGARLHYNRQMREIDRMVEEGELPSAIQRTKTLQDRFRSSEPRLHDLYVKVVQKQVELEQKLDSNQ